MATREWEDKNDVLHLGPIGLTMILRDPVIRSTEFDVNVSPVMKIARSPNPCSFSINPNRAIWTKTTSLWHLMAPQSMPLSDTGHVVRLPLWRRAQILEFVTAMNSSIC